MMSPFVFYGRIQMTSVSILHIGGDSEENFELAVNGDQQFIIPASGLVGCIRHYLEKDHRRAVTAFFGDRDRNGRAYVYDAVLDSYSGVETRNGIEIDRKYGTARNGRLYTRYYLSEGTKTCLQMKVYCQSKDEFTSLFQAIADGIQAGDIAFGANRSNGAGCFKVDHAEYRILNLQNEKELETYLQDDANWKGTAYTPKAAEKSNDNLFVLEAEIPNGLIVKDGEKHRGVNSYNIVRIVQGKQQPYIPGTSIKGLLKAHADRILKYYGKGPEMLAGIYGSDPDGAPAKGHVFVEDVDITNACRRVYTRTKIDRLKGSGIDGGLMTEEVLSTKEGKTIRIVVRIDSAMDETLQKTARALVWLSLRDLGAGYLSIGSGNNVGYGRLKGITLSVGEHVCKYSYDGDSVQLSIPDDLRSELDKGLKILQGGDQ